MEDAGIDTLLVSSPEGACWLHGYRSRWNKMQSPTEWPPLQMTAVNAADPAMGAYLGGDRKESPEPPPIGGALTSLMI